MCGRPCNTIEDRAFGQALCAPLSDVQVRGALFFFFLTKFGIASWLTLMASD